jgi:hypothetical protein
MPLNANNFGLYSLFYVFFYGRIRGLQPNCEYRVGLKASKSNIHVERTIPALHTVKVSLLDLLISVPGLDSLNPDRSLLLNADPEAEQGFLTKYFPVKKNITIFFSLYFLKPL